MRRAPARSDQTAEAAAAEAAALEIVAATAVHQGLAEGGREIAAEPPFAPFSEASRFVPRLFSSTLTGLLNQPSIKPALARPGGQAILGGHSTAAKMILIFGYGRALPAFDLVPVGC